MCYRYRAGLGMACGMAFGLAVTDPLVAQTGPGVDSATLMRARVKAAVRAHADSTVAIVGPRLTVALHAAQTSQKPVLVYVVESWSHAGAVFDEFVQSAAFSPLLRDNFVLVRLTGEESQAIRSNSSADATWRDSTLCAVAASKLSVVDSTGTVWCLPAMALGSLMELWTASHRLQQLAPRLTEADRQRIVDYLMLWAHGS